MEDDQGYNINTNPWGNLQEFFPKVILPSVPLTGDLAELHTFLTSQKPNPEVDTELKNMTKKELDAKIRDLENWNFRLYLDEGREINCGQRYQILSPNFPILEHKKSTTKQDEPNTNNEIKRKNKRHRRLHDGNDF